MYLRAKCEVSSLILTGFRQGVGLILPPPPFPSKRTPKKPTQIRVNSSIKRTFVSYSKYKKLLILIVMSLHYILLVLKQVNAAVVVIISMIQMQKCVFLML